MSRRRLRDAVGHRLAGLLGPPLVRALGATYRVVVAGPERPEPSARAEPVLLALWHGRLLPIVVTHRGRGVVALVSEHRDGEYIGRVLERVGFIVARGSTTRGGARALFEMAAHARQGRDLAITPDGPRGPRLEVRAGVLAIAQRAGVAIVPTGAGASSAWVLPTWDRFLIPRPWSRVAVVYGEPLRVPSDGAADLEALRALLAERIEDATRRADEIAAGRAGVGEIARRGMADRAALGGTARVGMAAGGAGSAWSRPGPPASLSARAAVEAPPPVARPARANRGAPVLAVYRALTDLIYALAWPILSILERTRPDRWATRLGRVNGLPRGGTWVHAASVGEIAGARPLLAALADSPGGAPLVVSTMTVAGRRVAATGGASVAGAFLAPFDFRRAAGRALEALAPRALVLLETELWPNLLVEAARRRIPIAIANGRISDRTAGRYGLLRPLFAPALASVSWIGAQTERDRERFIALGAAPDSVEVVGSSKEDARGAEPSGRDERRRALGLGGDDVLLVFGSARSAEDDVFLPVVKRLLDAHPALRVLYAPRHVERVGALSARMAQIGIAARPLAAWRRAPGPERALVLDTIGELAALYGAADVAVVGGSFSRHGGHNPIEPARCGVPVVMGPSRENVRDAWEWLAASGGAEEAADGGALERALTRLVGSEAERARRGAALRAAVEGRASVTRRIVDALVERGVLGRRA